MKLICLCYSSVNVIGIRKHLVLCKVLTLSGLHYFWKNAIILWCEKQIFCVRSFAFAFNDFCTRFDTLLLCFCCCCCCFCSRDNDFVVFSGAQYSFGCNTLVAVNINWWLQQQQQRNQQQRLPFQNDEKVLHFRDFSIRN